MDLVEMLFNNAMNAEGGGGGASFADVTFISSGGAYKVLNLITEDDEGFSRINPVIKISSTGEPITCRILLGSNGKAKIDGECFANIDGSAMPTVTGDIVFASNGFEISGNGTITAKGITSQGGITSH